MPNDALQAGDASASSVRGRDAAREHQEVAGDLLAVGA